MTQTRRSEESWEQPMVDDQEDIKQEEEEEEDDDGPPPGFHCIAWQMEAKKLSAEDKNVDKLEEAAEEDEDEDIDGPPPGWSPIPPTVQPIHTPDVRSKPVQLNSSQHADVEMSENQEVLEDEDGPPPGWNLILPTSQVAEAVPNDRDMGSHQEGARGSDEGAQPGHKVVTPSQLLPPTPPPAQPAVSLPSEKGQMVCGSCRQLLAYPRGIKYVQCSCCQTINLVLEAHQVGQVKCAGCAVLLMYPEGAPSVRCCSCRFVTEIGPHNRRPPLSLQQARRLPSLNRVH